MPMGWTPDRRESSRKTARAREGPSFVPLRYRIMNTPTPIRVTTKGFTRELENTAEQGMRYEEFRAQWFRAQGDTARERACLDLVARWRETARQARIDAALRVRA